MNKFSPAFLLASSLVLVSTPALAGVRSWQFNEGQNRLEFTTDEGVQPQAQLVSNPTRLVIDLPGVVLGRSKLEKSYRGNIRAIRIGQFNANTARIVVELAPGYTLDPQQVKFRGLTARQWSVQLPNPSLVATGNKPAVVVETKESNGASSISRSPNTRPWQARPEADSSSDDTDTQVATIDAVELNQSGTQLLIRGDRTLRYNTRWDSSDVYRITIANAKLAKNLSGPSLVVGSSIQRLRLRQESANTVAVLLQTATGVKIDAINQPSQRSISVEFQRPRLAGGSSRTIGSIPVPPPSSSGSFPSFPTRPIAPIGNIPRVTNSRPVVVVDPGHGGPDPGAVGVGGIQEKDIVLDVGIQLANILQQQGVQSVLTRQSDIDLDLQPRVDMAAQVNATLFVSIHANAIDMSRPDVNGLETYYYDSGEGLARTIHESVLEATGVPDRRVRTARFFVLRRTSMPSVLVELGFVTGQDDAARLANPRHRTLLAQAIARGILRYIQRTAASPSP